MKRLLFFQKMFTIVIKLFICYLFVMLIMKDRYFDNFHFIMPRFWSGNNFVFNLIFFFNPIELMCLFSFSMNSIRNLKIWYISLNMQLNWSNGIFLCFFLKLNETIWNVYSFNINWGRLVLDSNYNLTINIFNFFFLLVFNIYQLENSNFLNIIPLWIFIVYFLKRKVVFFFFFFLNCL